MTSEEMNSIERLQQVIKQVEESAGLHVTAYMQELKQALEEKGKRYVELNFTKYSALFLSAVILDRMAEVPRMVKFIAVCDELMYGKETHEELIQMAERSPRQLEDKRSVAKDYVATTVAMASKLGGSIQTSAEKDNPNEDIAGQVRRELEDMSREELIDLLTDVRTIREKRQSGEGILVKDE